MAALVALLTDPSLDVRQFARLELKRRDPAAVRAAVNDWVAAAPAAAAEQRTMQAMWIDECLNVVNPKRIADAFAAENERVRAAAVRLIGYRRGELDRADDLLQRAVADRSALVRLEAVAALGRGTRSRDIEVALRVIDRGPLDDHLDFALWTAARNLLPQWAPRLAAGEFDFDGRVERLVFLLSAAGNPEAAAPILAAVTETSDVLAFSDAQAAALAGPLAGIASEAQLHGLLGAILGQRDWSSAERARILDALLSQTARRGIQLRGMGTALISQLREAWRGPGETTPAWADALLRAGARWKVTEMAPLLLTRLDGVLDSASVSPLDLQVVKTLGALGTPAGQQSLVEIARDGDAAVELRVEAAVALLGSSRDASLAAVRTLLRDPATSATMIARCNEILGRKGMFEPFAELLADLQLLPDDARALVSVARSVGAPEEMVAAVRAAGNLDEISWQWTEQLKDEILALAAQGNPRRGEQIYRRESLQCIQCHAIGEGGGLVGPNLVSLGGAAAPDYILRSLIEPNDKLKEGFTTTKILTLDGRVLQGIAAGGDQQSLQLRTAEGELLTIPRGEIEAQSPGQSLMPAGLVDPLSKQELADLTRFLSELGRTPAYTVGTRPLVRNVERLVYTPEANRRLNRTSTDSVASDEAVFQWQPLTSLVSGAIPVGEIASFQQHRGLPPTGYIRFEIEVGDNGRAALGFSADRGLQMWVDGRPTPIASAGQLKLAPGTHRITLGIDQSVVTDRLQIERLE
jgi:hypothetical protein